MRSRSLRRLTAVTTLALAAVAAAACTATAEPARPRPAATAATPARTTPAAAAPTPGVTTPAAPVVAVKPVHVATPKPPNTSTGATCLGAVVHKINAADTGRPWKPLCITVGGVLRIENLGPGDLTKGPSDKIDCWYEAGTHECRLIRTGTVRFTVTTAHQTQSLTVVVAKAPASPGPEPACPRIATHTVDASDVGSPWPAICVRLGTLLRLVNFGPDGFTVSPAANVTGWYEAGQRQLTFVKTGTVTFTLTYEDAQTRTLTVVVNR